MPDDTNLCIKACSKYHIDRPERRHRASMLLSW